MDIKINLEEEENNSEYKKQIEQLKFDFYPNFESTNFTKENLEINNINNETGIIIDNGSYECKAGWSICSEPNLKFRSLVAKSKLNDSLLHSFIVGNQIFEFEQGKIHKKSPFEKNIPTHFGTQEHIFDHIFSNLNINDENVNHPILLTEPFCNLNYSRKNLTEMLFELYGIPSLYYGVDMFFSLYHNNSDFRKTDFLSNEFNSLIISSSYQTTHIVPIINWIPDIKKSRRIGIGAENARELLMMSFHLKHPELKQRLTNEVIQHILENYTMCAIDYEYQLKLLEKVFQENDEKYKQLEIVNIFGTIDMYNKVMNSINKENNFINKKKSEKSNFSYLKTYTNLVDYIDEKNNNYNPEKNLIRNIIFFERPSFLALPILSQEEIKSKEEQKKEQSRRLKEIIQKKKEEKYQKLQNELTNLERIIQLKETDKFTFEEELTHNGFENLTELENRINKISTKLNNNIANLDNNNYSKEDLDKRYPLLLIDDNQLTSEQLKMKRIQKMQKNAFLNRLEKREAAKKEKERIEELKQKDPEKYLINLYKTKKEILDRLKKYQDLKKDMMNRHSKLNMKRIQVLAELGQDKNDETSSNGKSSKSNSNNEDDFGKNDEDWDAYREVNKNNLQKEEEDENNRLHEVENQIKEMDKDYYKNIQNYQYNFYTKNNYFPFGVDQFRCCEILFKPYLIGIEQAGLSEVISQIFKTIDIKTQEKLVGNIFLTGGNVKYPYLKERIIIDLTQYLPSNMNINLNIANDPILDAWKGGRDFFNNNIKNDKVYISKKDYEEFGFDYYKENICGNKKYDN